jgi:putative oxidoreductase
VRALERVHPGWGIAAVRIMAGIILVIAGWQKFSNGIGGFAGFIGGRGFPAPEVLAPLVVAFELIGGLLILAGFGVRWLGIVMIVQFFIAGTFVQMQGQQGWSAARLDYLLLAVGVMLVLAGAGKASVDEMLARRRGAPVGARM